MITRISANGFKSLENFEMDLQPGLNILIGPNGSGKTNIILFFEFLSNLARGDVSDAIGRLGGVGSLFRRMGDGNYQYTITAQIYGCSPAKNRFIFYKYAFEVLFPREIESVVFSKQAVSIKYVDEFVPADMIKDHEKNWDLSIIQTFDATLTPIIKVDELNAKAIKIPAPGRPAEYESTKKKQIIDIVKSGSSANETILFSLPRYAGLFDAILDDMLRGETYNIIPSRIRAPEDSATVPGIEKDGAGLAATLYALKRQITSPSFKFAYGTYFRRRILRPSLTLSDLLKYVNLANTSIADIDVANDPFDNKLKVTLLIQNGQYTAKLPLAEMSDGTLKWMALITAVLTASSILSIEEPENYLHPLMQAEILKIMRSVLAKEIKYAFTIMTTHSETILNSSNPEELVVVSLNEGRTQARRCSNITELREEIKRTGFGLGYYYLAGALQDE